MKLLLYVLFIIFSIPTAAEDKKGICLEWIEGEGFDLENCRPYSISECSKGKEAVPAMEGFSGKLFKSKDGKVMSEFQEKPASACKALLISAARGKEGTASEYSAYIVYSDKLKKGDTAYIYGENVNVREKGSVKAKKLFSLNKGVKVEILDKSAKRENVMNSGYWFQISVDGKKGWVFGAFIHPDPDSEKPFIGNSDNK